MTVIVGFVVAVVNMMHMSASFIVTQGRRLICSIATTIICLICSIATTIICLIRNFVSIASCSFSLSCCYIICLSALSESENLEIQHLVQGGTRTGDRNDGGGGVDHPDE